MYVIGNIFSQIDSLREAWCVNMFSSYMVNFNEEYVKDRCYVFMTLVSGNNFFINVFSNCGEKLAKKHLILFWGYFVFGCFYLEM